MSYFTIDSKTIGMRIRTLRKALPKAQYEFAEMLYISPSYLALIESGKRAPTLEVLVQISRFCHVSLDYLVFGETSEYTADPYRTIQAMKETYSPDQMQKALRLAAYYLAMETPENILPQEKAEQNEQAPAPQAADDTQKRLS